MSWLDKLLGIAPTGSPTPVGESTAPPADAVGDIQSETIQSSLNPSAVMTFFDYDVQDNGISLHFVCLNPGGGQPSDYYVSVTDAELVTITSQSQLQALVTAKLQRRYRATGISSKLDAFIGRSVMI